MQHVPDRVTQEGRGREGAMFSRGLIAGTLLLAAAECRDSTDPAVTLRLQSSPDFSAIVTKSTLVEGVTPEGWMSAYEVWVAIPPSATADAGVLVPTEGPVYRITGGTRLATDTASDISAGDSIEVWHDGLAVYGAAQAPPGAPAYFATQIVIVR